MNLSASEARAKLFPLIEELNAGGDPVLISSKAGNAVLLSESEYNGLLESLYIFSNPENLLSINQSIAELKRGEGFTYSPPKAGAPATFAPRKAPEQLRDQSLNLWSRRISVRDRLIYQFTDDVSYIIQLMEHFKGR